MKKSRLWLVILLIVLTAGIALGLYIRSQRSSNAMGPEAPVISADSSAAATTTNKLIIGSPNAKVTLVEYGDFKCPICNKFFRGALQQLKTDYVDKGIAKIEFRNLPYINPDSRVAAEGAYCANDQKKFEAYHNAAFNYIWDKYYGTNNVRYGEEADVFNPRSLHQIAAEIGLDTVTFDSCLAGGVHRSDVDADLSASAKDKVTGTPTILVGNQKIIGAQPATVYSTLIEQELN